jgi:hypothetical protein
LEKAIRRPDIVIPLIEFKWAGTFLAAIGIAPGATRAFDAFFIQHSRATLPRFNALTDATDYVPSITESIGEYVLKRPCDV